MAAMTSSAVPVPDSVATAGYTTSRLISTGTGQADIWLATGPSDESVAVKVFKAPVDYRSERDAMQALAASSSTAHRHS